MLVESDWQGSKTMKALSGGDVLTQKLANKILKYVGELWNMYGPTETTIWSSICKVEPDYERITIGKPINNTQMYILDNNLSPLPRGVIGELHIGGDGLAKGYLNNSRLTSEKFIEDRFRHEPTGRLYKTGDHARYLQDYSIEVLGRIDHQVKINGHRIELGEITTIMLQNTSISEATVVARTEKSGERRLVAYFVPGRNSSISADEIRSFLRIKLPSYMVPTVFISLDSLPLTPNGKLDRSVLPVPNDTLNTVNYEAPRNRDERILVNIWQDVLDMEQVGIYDNFFELGGASIQSLQIVAKANMAGFRMSPENIFEFQTVAELYENIKSPIVSDIE
jgi:acyl-CoA synthetase (AMP-forming)/AMP-acid ligase II